MWHEAFLQSIRQHLLEEGFPRLRKCLHELSEEELWQRPNASSNAAGNLVLHLCGNVHQWVLSALGGAPDIRQRAKEFSERGTQSREELLNCLDQLEAEVAALLPTLSPEQLLQTYEVQIFRPTGMGILIHVTEHFSYHLGQITYIVKMQKDRDMGYYDDTAL